MDALNYRIFRQLGETPSISNGLRVVRKFRIAGALCISCILLAGCAIAPTATANPRQVWCDHSQPRRDATAETPRAELDEINTHNLKGARWCGWAP